MDINNLTLCELKRALDRGEVTSERATEACLDAINKQTALNNFITVCDNALYAAREADRRRKAGERLPLLGVPVAVKDNIVTKGVKTTCASKFLQNFVPPYDAAVVEKLKAAGAVILGKTNMDEFAMGSTDENSAFGAVLNVHDNTRVPGGSSGGSANCVAACQAYLALGSDTGGSIRQPSSYCGVVGLKPTYSAVSRYGLIAFASSLDQIGTLTRDCDDAFAAFKMISGRDERDSTSAQTPPLPDALDDTVKGKTIAVADEFLNTDKLDDGVRAVFESALAELSARGAVIKRVSIKSFRAALSVYYVLSGAEASSNLARFDGVKYGMRASEYKDISELYTESRSRFFGDEVKRRIMTGSYVLSSGYYDAYYLKASRIRTVIKREFDATLENCDFIMSPTAPTVAPRLGEQSDPHKTYLSDMYTVPVNISGLPAVSVPYGSAHGMPVGVQIIGRSFSEASLLGLGKAIMKPFEA